mmetsp:Transcript_1047/g.1762  ORF Transcript_1047/g.1762 Transcript_1047/m.1762 type:complete len:246 (-) Transcript_1047:1627-2364(-)
MRRFGLSGLLWRGGLVLLRCFGYRLILIGRCRRSSGAGLIGFSSRRGSSRRGSSRRGDSRWLLWRLTRWWALTGSTQGGTCGSRRGTAWRRGFVGGRRVASAVVVVVAAQMNGCRSRRHCLRCTFIACGWLCGRWCSRSWFAVGVVVVSSVVGVVVGCGRCGICFVVCVWLVQCFIIIGRLRHNMKRADFALHKASGVGEGGATMPRRWWRRSTNTGVRATRQHCRWRRRSRCCCCFRQCHINFI